jgi:hypothetical protein
LKSLVEILPLSLARWLAMRQISQDRSAEVSLHLSQPIGPQQKRDHDRATVGCELPERQEADGLYRARFAGGGWAPVSRQFGTFGRPTASLG